MAVDMGKRMFFVIGAPRSGTTMLMRILNAHPDIYTRPEPHLLTPLSHLGYYDYVDKASYDPYQAAQSSRQFVNDLPNGEADYLEALRAYTDTLYSKMLEPTGKRYFVDKTPAYALVLPFIAKLYPEAKFVVITRHPFAVFSSFAKSFFDSDWEAAHEHNPLIERYIPALARFLKEAPVPYYHVKYEELVEDPERVIRGLCAYAEMEYDPEMIHYGKKKMEVSGLGDPIGVNADTKPNTKSVEKWAKEVKGNEKRRQLLQQALNYVFDEELETLGFTREGLWAPLEEVDPEAAQKAQSEAKKWDKYHVQRRLLVNLRKGIHGNFLGKTLKSVQFYSDVLLRDTWADQLDDRDK